MPVRVRDGAMVWQICRRFDVKKKDKEPNVWVTTLKLALGAAALIGGVGFALWYVSETLDMPDPAIPEATPERAWGIANDNPIRPKR